MKDTTVILNEFKTATIENIAEYTAKQDILDDSEIKIKRLCVDVRNIGLSYHYQKEDTTIILNENGVEDLIEQET